MKSKLTTDPGALRCAAAARLKARPAASQPQTEADLRRLQQELELHQIELEMQNEELRTAQVEIQAGLERYSDLFDFAPVGYFHLTRSGAVRLVNLTGASLVGRERANLVGKLLPSCFVEPDRATVHSLLAQVFATGTKQACEVTLESQNPLPRHVRLEAMCSADGESCRTVMMDITERKEAEAALRQKNTELEAALVQVKKLKRLLPICAGCKKIRNDGNYWQEVEVFITENSETTFTHGLCPDCVKKYYPEVITT